MNQSVYSEGYKVNIQTVYCYGVGRNVYTPSVFETREQVRSWSVYVVKRFGSDSGVISFIKEILLARSVGLVRVLLRRRRVQYEMTPRETFLKRLHSFRLSPDSFRYDRAVGIEIECVCPNGVQVPLPYWARKVMDGSVRTNGVQGDAIEYNILLLRRELEHRLYKFCQLIKAHSVNKSCGLHIHLDCRGKDQKEVLTIARKMNAWLYSLRELVPPSRLENQYCRFGVSTTDRYRAVNVCSFREHKTLEVRLHSGTVDYTKIISWVRLLELLLVIQSKPKSGWGCLQVLGQLPLCEYERSYWMQRHRTLNPSSYPSAAPSNEVE
jgi:hypothetical protein